MQVINMMRKTGCIIYVPSYDVPGYYVPTFDDFVKDIFLLARDIALGMFGMKWGGMM